MLFFLCFNFMVKIGVENQCFIIFVIDRDILEFRVELFKEYIEYIFKGMYGILGLFFK